MFILQYSQSYQVMQILCCYNIRYINLIIRISLMTVKTTKGGHHRHNTNSKKRLMIEKDEVYQDPRFVQAVCENLNQSNAQQLSTTSFLISSKQEELFSSEPIHKKPSQKTQKWSIDCVLSFNNVHSCDLMKDYGEGVEETQRTQSITQSIYVQNESGRMEEEDGEEQGVSEMEDESKDQMKKYEEKEEPVHPSQQLHERKFNRSYTKNLASNIGASIRKLILTNNRNQVRKICKEKLIPFEEFQNYCAKNKFKGINSIAKFFRKPKTESEKQMQEILHPLFKQILRGGYLPTTFRSGKMTDLEAYINYKNKYLMNLEYLMNLDQI